MVVAPEHESPPTSHPRDECQRLDNGRYNQDDWLVHDPVLEPLLFSTNETTPILVYPYPMSSVHDTSLTSAITGFSSEDAGNALKLGKGKGVSRPVMISASTQSQEEDIFTMSLVGSPVTEVMTETSGSPAAHPNLSQDDGRHNDQASATSSPIHSSSVAIPFSNKGKGKAPGPPVLPPLSFTPMEVRYGRLDWPSPGSSSSSGPSTHRSLLTSLMDQREQAVSPPPPCTSLSPASETSPPSSPRLSRIRTLSNASIQSTRSLASKIKVKLGSSKSPRALTKKLRSNRSSLLGDNASTYAVDGLPSSPAAVSPWSLGPSVTPFTIDPLTYTHETIAAANLLSQAPSRNAILLANRGRAYTSPYPLTSAIFDIVPPSASDLSLASPPAPISLFDDKLPLELKIGVFVSLVHIYEADHKRLMANGKWSALRAAASRNQWVGAARGLREIIKLGRVSRSWLDLTRDGQLWGHLDLRFLPHVPHDTILGIAKVAGAFITHLDLAGHGELGRGVLRDITRHITPRNHQSGGLAHTNLTNLNLRRVPNISSKTLHDLLIASPFLKHICLRGVSAVINHTGDILGIYCRDIEVLNVSRCRNIDGSGLESLCSAASDRGEQLHLRELHASGLKYVSSKLMGRLARMAPVLEVLDLSHAHGLDDHGMRVFVHSWEHAMDDKILLTARQAGEDPSNPAKFWRRITRLRHLSVSGCTSLSDTACKHLAHAVPRLQLLEMAGIGSGLHDEGLIHLLRTTPLIKKLDLEDDLSLTNHVIDALTPVPQAERSLALSIGMTGDMLEHLTISYMTEVTDDAVLRLIAGCHKLKTLEMDNTHLSSKVVQSFVNTMRSRQQQGTLIAAGDNRNVGENAVRDLHAHTRPRLGFRSWEGRHLAYLDYRDKESLEKIGGDECDPNRVILKSFYTWQTVDAVRAARKKKARSGSRRLASWEEEDAQRNAGEVAGRARWWSRRGSAPTTPNAGITDPRDAGDACIIM